MEDAVKEPVIHPPTKRGNSEGAHSSLYCKGKEFCYAHWKVNCNILSRVTQDTDKETVQMGVDVGMCCDARDKTGVFVKIISTDVPPNKDTGCKGQYGSSLNIIAELNCFMEKKK